MASPMTSSLDNIAQGCRFNINHSPRSQNSPHKKSTGYTARLYLSTTSLDFKKTIVTSQHSLVH